MQIQKPKTKQDLDILRCWLNERLLFTMLVTPLITFFFSFLSYLLLIGCLELRKYTETLTVLPMELRNVKTVINGFASSSILLNSGFVLFLIGTIPLLFSHYAKECIISERTNSQKNIVWDGIRDYTIRDNSDIKYLRRRYNILKYWKTKFPKTMVIATFLFWIIVFSISVCVTQIITNGATVKMWLNLPVVALMIYFLRLITDKDLFLLRFYISTYTKILPDVAEDTTEDADSESDLEDDFSGEAGKDDSLTFSGEAGSGDTWETFGEVAPPFAMPSAMGSTIDDTDDFVVGIDDAETDNCFDEDDLFNDFGEDSE